MGFCAEGKISFLGHRKEAEPTPVGGVAENGSLATTISPASDVTVTGTPGIVNPFLPHEEEKVPAGSAGTPGNHRHPTARKSVQTGVPNGSAARVTNAKADVNR